jgi:hypothetical protein
MKKFFFIGAVVMLTSLASFGQTFKYVSFLGGNQSVYLTNNVALSYGDTLVAYTNVMGVSVYSLTNLYTTAAFTAATLAAVVTNSNTTFPAAWLDVSAFANKSGDIVSGGAYALSATLKGSSASATNVTFVFTPILGTKTVKTLTGNATLSPILGTSADQVTLTVLSAGTALVSARTNIPPAQAVGVQGWRLTSITTANNGLAANVYVLNAGLSGFAP